jgi:succinate dehydrogenase flavin-adding protein (antitoxin of CptAB toxin-antitoxin module)
MDLDQIIALFESKHTRGLADRHAQSIIQLCQQMDNELV